MRSFIYLLKTYLSSGLGTPEEYEKLQNGCEDWSGMSLEYTRRGQLFPKPPLTSHGATSAEEEENLDF